MIASYNGDAYDQASASKPVTETVVAASVSATITPVNLDIKPGASGTLTITITPKGGYTGTVSFFCGTLPVNVSCTFAPPSITLSANGKAVTDTLTVNTSTIQSAMLSSPMDGKQPAPVYLGMMLWVPGSLAALAGIFPRKRKQLFGRRLWVIALLLLGMGGVAAMSGCGGMRNTAQPGVYEIPVTLTLSGGMTQTVNTTIIVQ